MAGLIVLGIIVVVIGLWSSVKFVPAGHVGVLVVFGQVQDATLPEGVHLANPMAVNHVLSVRTVEKTEKASVPSKEGLIVTLDVTLLFRLDPTKAHEVYQTIGPRYVSVVVDPNLRSAIRSVTSAYSANALYTGEREVVAQKIVAELSTQLEPRGITVENILLRDIQLPPALKQSIEAKQQAEQDALRMEFILQKETQEAARKRIEAQGIRDFQRIVAQGLSQQYLTWKGIEATEKLAGSPNAKVVVIGSGKGGLPIILGGQ
jgi:regulator of protease activity HflC (stomatin/prohibitin superfamily)